MLQERISESAAHVNSACNSGSSSAAPRSKAPNFITPHSSKQGYGLLSGTEYLRNVLTAGAVLPDKRWSKLAVHGLLCRILDGLCVGNHRHRVQTSRCPVPLASLECGRLHRLPDLNHGGQWWLHRASNVTPPRPSAVIPTQLLRCPLSSRSSRSERRTGHKAISRGPQQASSSHWPAVQAHRLRVSLSHSALRCRLPQREAPQPHPACCTSVPWAPWLLRSHPRDGPDHAPCSLEQDRVRRQLSRLARALSARLVLGSEVGRLGRGILASQAAWRLQPTVPASRAASRAAGSRTEGPAAAMATHR